MAMAGLNVRGSERWAIHQPAAALAGCGGGAQHVVCPSRTVGLRTGKSRHKHCDRPYCDTQQNGRRKRSGRSLVSLLGLNV